MTTSIQQYPDTTPIGLGANKAHIHVYIENIPPLPEYQQLSSVMPLQAGIIKEIGQLTGNHWRKIFNVFAKLLFEYNQHTYLTWQALRDNYLLQTHSNECLLFSNIGLDEIHVKSTTDKHAAITLIMGKTYANKLDISEHCYWVSEHFAINTKRNIIVCPYFDYRQLSNIKITQLVQLMKQLNE